MYTVAFSWKYWRRSNDSQLKYTSNHKRRAEKGPQDFCTNSPNYFCITCLYIAVRCVHATHRNQDNSLSLDICPTHLTQWFCSTKTEFNILHWHKLLNLVLLTELLTLSKHLLLNKEQQKKFIIETRCDEVDNKWASPEFYSMNGNTPWNNKILPAWNCTMLQWSSWCWIIQQMHIK